MTHKNCHKSLAADCCIRNIYINCLQYSILHLTTVKMLNTIVFQEKSYVCYIICISKSSEVSYIYKSYVGTVER